MVKIEESWKKRIGSEFEKPYMRELKNFLQDEYGKKKKIFPKTSEYFKAFEWTPVEKTKVVILGQDPYHGPGQAHGLCFSVRPDVATPPSLQNIYKELLSDLQIPIPDHGCLVEWAERGVLLLNATLSVEAGRAGSHQNRGWENFTDRVIETLNSEREGLVFVLWGSYAQKKGAFVDRKKHLVLEAPHPSPLSSYRGFFGSRPFSKINTYLVSKGQEPIQWQLSSKAELLSRMM